MVWLEIGSDLFLIILNIMLIPAQSPFIQPKIGDKVTIKSTYWTKRGLPMSKICKGIVQKVEPFADGSDGYNVTVSRFFGLCSYRYAIDHRLNHLSFSGYPHWLMSEVE